MAMQMQSSMPPAGKRPGINRQARIGVVPRTQPDADNPTGKAEPGEGSLAEELLDARQQSRESKRPVTIAQTRRMAKQQARGGVRSHPAHRAAMASRRAVTQSAPVQLPGSMGSGY